MGDARKFRSQRRYSAHAHGRPTQTACGAQCRLYAARNAHCSMGGAHTLHYSLQCIWAARTHERSRGEL